MTRRGPFRWITWAGGLTVALCAMTWLARPAPAVQKPTTEPAIPDVVILDQLSKTEGLYEPVPFDHKAHATMSRMQGGCTTCHHRTPEADAKTAASMPSGTVLVKRQADAAIHPACRTCHEPHRVDLHQPGLKGAYHRQCLNCHREWAHANDCSVCHKPKGSLKPKPVTVDDVMGRMHPPVAEPNVQTIKANFTPADGGNVIFRHKEHIDTYGIKCVSCHRAEDSCARCHDQRGSGAARTIPAARPVVLGRSWDEAHRNCNSCHTRQENRCNTCHFKDDQPPPAPFDHASTGQVLDADHVSLKCTDCHGGWTSLSAAGAAPKAAIGCGAASCHAKSPEPIRFPRKRPGPFVPPPSQDDAAPPVRTLPVPVKQASVDGFDAKPAPAPAHEDARKTAPKDKP